MQWDGRKKSQKKKNKMRSLQLTFTLHETQNHEYLDGGLHFMMQNKTSGGSDSFSLSLSLTLLDYLFLSFIAKKAKNLKGVQRALFFWFCDKSKEGGILLFSPLVSISPALLLSCSFEQVSLLSLFFPFLRPLSKQSSHPPPLSPLLHFSRQGGIHVLFSLLYAFFQGSTTTTEG